MEPLPSAPQQANDLAEYLSAAAVVIAIDAVSKTEKTGIDLHDDPCAQRLVA